MAVEYLAGNRLKGTLAEMEALTISNISDGSVFYATDTNKEYVLNSSDSSWRGLNDDYITPAIEATNATFSQSGGYDYYLWTGNGSVTIQGYSVDLLVVGGGGNGHGAYKGGGGSK